MQQIIDREQEIVFTNFTKEAFEMTWNGRRLYHFEAGKSYYLPFYLAETFAKHLVDRELNNQADTFSKANPTMPMNERQFKEQSILNNSTTRQELMDQCVKLPEDPASIRLNDVRRVPLREVKLQSDLRRENDIATGKVSPSDIPARVVVDETAPAIGDKEAFEGV